ncbi:MAG: 4'-phosphopantetheinyl transferase superfamily protein [Planctomycetes bacterium]|nr:4'-phosphopantetheinyl transferase superfamily protein [Planctomycetota bacterium]
MPNALNAPRVVLASCDELGGTPTDGEVRMWAIPLDAPPQSEATLFACLTNEERERADRYKIRKPRHQFVTGRGLLRQILGNCLRQSPCDVPITYTGAGKPVLGVGELHFNVTHTDAVALIALATRPVGIDVEQVRTLANPDGLVERFFSVAECAAYRDLPTELRPQGFFRAWTCKEAIIKAAGLSVTTLSEFDVELNPTRPATLLAARHPELIAKNWGLTAWEPIAGFAAAVAVSTKA